MMRFRLAAVLLAMVWPGVAQAAWLEASSEHFVIYADDTERDVTRFAQQLERFHAGMAMLLNSKSAAPSPSNRVTVYVVRNQREVRTLHGGDNKYIGGYYVPRAGGSLAIVPTINSGGGEDNWSMVVLLHEYAHHFLISASSAPMPRWFSEGAAEFFASAKFEADGGLWLGRPAQHRAYELFAERDVKAADLLDPVEYEKHKQKSYDAFYGKSWLLYHYLTFDAARKGQLARYVDLLRTGKGQREAGAEAFGDFGVLEKDLDRYLVKRRINALRLSAEVVPVGAVRIRALPVGEAAMMPVRIRSKNGIGSVEQANTLLAEARVVAARYPADPAVLAALAECEHDAGNDKEAIAAADKAIAADPTQTNAYVQKGLSLFRIAAAADDQKLAYRKAREPFIALNKIENDHPLPLIYFYRSFAEQGIKPPSLAMDGMVRAVQLAPFDLGLRMNLAQALIQVDRQKEARTVLLPVAYNPHGGKASEFARTAIEQIEKNPAWKGENLNFDDAADEGEAAS